MAYWLLKTEPNDYSIDDLQADLSTPWTGIRNYQARNFIRDKMCIGDGVLIYHSSCKEVGVVGMAIVASNAYADPDQFNEDSKYYDANVNINDPKWFVVDIGFKAKAKQRLSLQEMKASIQLSDLALIKQSRLSVSPVDEQQWQFIIDKLGET
jgi:predicted RNA-binding protein with PUA-like domain